MQINKLYTDCNFLLLIKFLTDVANNNDSLIEYYYL